MWSKSVLASTKVWANLIAMVISVLTLLIGQDWIPPVVVGYITALVIPILNILLKWLNVDPEPIHVMKAFKYQVDTKGRVRKGG